MRLALTRIEKHRALESQLQSQVQNKFPATLANSHSLGYIADSS